VTRFPPAVNGGTPSLLKGGYVWAGVVTFEQECVLSGSGQVQDDV